MPAIAITLHLLAVIIWVGGMFVAYMAVRPALAGLDTATRARLWTGILARFLPWVWASVLAILLTGFYMVFNNFEGFGGAPMFVQMMMGLGIFMMMLVGHVTFSAFKKLKRAVAGNDEALAGKSMRQIRVIMAVNLGLGLFIVVMTMLGMYLAAD